MKGTLTIARRELEELAARPFAWGVAALALVLPGFNLALSTLHYNRMSQRAEAMAELGLPPVSTELVEPFFGFLGVLLLFLAPLWTMGLMAEERRQNTLPLLQSAPVGSTAVVAGKFLGILAWYLVFLGLATSQVLALSLFGGAEAGALASALLGTVLLGAAMLAVGLAASSFTRVPVVAAVGSFSALLLLWLLEVVGLVINNPSWQRVFEEAGLVGHAQALWTGQVALSDISYFLLLTLVALGLARQRLDAGRWS